MKSQYPNGKSSIRMDKPVSEQLKPATSYTRIDANGHPYLEGSRCEACGAVFLGLRENCGRCGARGRMRSFRFAERGQLYNYTIVYRSYPGIKVPFISAIVDLDGGGTVKGNLLDVEPDPKQLRFGMPVRMVFRGAEVASAEGVGYVAHFFIPEGDGALG
jgi:uncharacterized OB-fold protein